MIFLTVGTQFGFDRLVEAVDHCLAQKVIDDAVFAQIGPGRYIPKHMDSAPSLDRDSFITMVHSCDGIVSHAGMGSITMALDAGRALLVMPRRAKYGEVVNDHQVESAMRFEKLGHVLVAYDTDELPEQLARLRTFVPEGRVANRDGVIERVRGFLSERVPVAGDHDRRWSFR